MIAASFVPPVNAAVDTSDFYLGTSTGEGYDPFMGVEKGRRTAFGWAHLKPSFPGSTTLVMLGNVMSYDSPGIIVGTTTLVPEPGVTALFAVGLIGIVVRRHRPFPKRLPGHSVDLGGAFRIEAQRQCALC